MGLIERIAFHLEGTETTFSRDASGVPTHIEQSWGPERWIRAAASGRMTAIDLLAVIVFQDYLTPGIDAQAVAEGWLAELRRAVEAGEVTPRDYSTLLPCRQEFERLEWVISKADAVAFLERRQSAIDLEATVAHLLGVVLRAGETHYHPGTGEPMRTLWDAGFMPTDGREATPASVEPVEWCGMLPVFRAELPCAERGRQSPPEPAQATEAPAHAPGASASPAARPEAVAGGWWESVLPYIAETMRAGGHKTAKELYRALERSSGSPGSPFEMVDRELRARDFRQSVARKTIENRIGLIRAAAGLK